MLSSYIHFQILIELLSKSYSVQAFRSHLRFPEMKGFIAKEEPCLHCLLNPEVSYPQIWLLGIGNSQE